MNEIEKLVRHWMDQRYARDLFGVELVSALPGAICLALPHRREFEHAPHFFQGTVTTAVGEMAASFSAASLSRPGWEHWTMEQSIHFLAPARGQRLVSQGSVIAAGRGTSVAQADIYIDENDERRLCASLRLTMRHRAPNTAGSHAGTQSYPPEPKT